MSLRSASRSRPWTLRRTLKWLLGSLLLLLVGVPVLLYLAFIAIQEASERQWLGKAPTHEAIDMRSREPHPVALLDVGFDSLATRLRLIEGASRSIELEFFIYEIDTASRLVTQALARKAREGVKVRLLVDFAMPVFKLAPHYAAELAAAGVEVRYYNTAGLARFFASNHRTHRKLLVADRHQAIIGGRNIADDYFDLSTHYNFLDSDLLIQGPVVAAIADSFELYWASDWVARPDKPVADPATDRALLLAQPSPADASLLAELRAHPSQHKMDTCHDIHFVTDYPGSGVERRKVFRELTRLSQEAKQQILVESPYLVLRDDGIAVLQHAGAARRQAAVPDQQPVLHRRLLHRGQPGQRARPAATAEARGLGLPGPALVRQRQGPRLATLGRARQARGLRRPHHRRRHLQHRPALGQPELRTDGRVPQQPSPGQRTPGQHPRPRRPVTRRGRHPHPRRLRHPGARRRQGRALQDARHRPVHPAAGCPDVRAFALSSSCSRSTRRCTLPVVVIGRASMNSISFGYS